MNLVAEFGRRQIISLLEKAVADKKLPDTLLCHFESCPSWPFTKAQEQILLSYATVDNLKKSAADSASTVKTIGKMSGMSNVKCDIDFSRPTVNYSPPERTREVYVPRAQPVDAYVSVSHEPRYSRGEWERIQKAERDKEIAKAKAFPKEPTLNKFYRKIEVGTE